MSTPALAASRSAWSEDEDERADRGAEHAREDAHAVEDARAPPRVLAARLDEQVDVADPVEGIVEREQDRERDEQRPAHGRELVEEDHERGRARGAYARHDLRAPLEDERSREEIERDVDGIEDGVEDDDLLERVAVAQHEDGDEDRDEGPRERLQPDAQLEPPEIRVDRAVERMMVGMVREAHARPPARRFIKQPPLRSLQHLHHSRPDLEDLAFLDERAE